MRAVELAKVAAAAEALRLRRIARRQGLRIAYAAGAAVFALAVLILLHVLCWNALQPMLTPSEASLVILVVDLLITIVFGVLALQNKPDAIESEAKAIRERAVVEMKQALTVMSMLASVTGVAVRSGARHGVRRGLTSAITESALRFIRR